VGEGREGRGEVRTRELHGDSAAHGHNLRANPSHHALVLQVLSSNDVGTRWRRRCVVMAHWQKGGGGTIRSCCPSPTHLSPEEKKTPNSSLQAAKTGRTRSVSVCVRALLCMCVMVMSVHGESKARKDQNDKPHSTSLAPFSLSEP